MADYEALPTGTQSPIREASPEVIELKPIEDKVNPRKV